MRNDINLIPKKIRVVSAKMMFLIIILSLIGIVLMGLYGLYLPLKERNELNNRIAQEQEKIRLYAEVDVTYIALTDQVNNLININTVFETLKNDNLKMTQVFQEFQKNIPKNMIIQNITYKDGELLMGGLSPTYKEVAQYIVKLRKIEHFLGVVFTSAYYESPKTDINNVIEPSNGDENKAMYKFEVKISLKTNDPPIEVLTPEEGVITDEKGEQ